MSTLKWSQLWVCLVLLAVGCGPTTIPEAGNVTEQVLPLTAVERATTNQSETKGPVGETKGPVGETKIEVQETLRSEVKPEVQSASVGVREAEAVTPASGVVESSPKPEQSFWITTKTKVRHNSRCRYYKNSKGTTCGPDDGRECKICGG